MRALTQDAPLSLPPARPHANCYWLPGGRIMAGEYPGHDDPAVAEAKLRRILDYGIDSFVDLTEARDRLRPYVDEVRQLGADRGMDVRYTQLSIRDMSVCTASHMTRILDHIDDEVRDGRVVYVHCWGGVGRTGTVVGCWFRRAGLNGPHALDLVARHWSLMSEEKRSRHRRGSPETREQCNVVLDWAEAPVRSGARGLLDRWRRARGCLVGGAVGDALGAAVEFESLGAIRAKHGSRGIAEFGEAYGNTGSITDDTQMTLFTAEGLLRAVSRRSRGGEWNPAAHAHKAYLRWLDTQRTASGSGRDHAAAPTSWLQALPQLNSRRAPGNTCLSALESGTMGTTVNRINSSKGCGGVMRVAPAGLMQLDDPFSIGCDIAAITHGHPSGFYSAGALALMIDRIVRGDDLRSTVNAAIGRLREHDEARECRLALENAVAKADQGSFTAEAIETMGGGWVGEEALAISVFCALASGGDFEKGVRLAVNHSGDSDSTGAITGNILGALLGEDAIPVRWRSGVELSEEILEIADDLVAGFRNGPAWAARWGA